MNFTNSAQFPSFVPSGVGPTPFGIGSFDAQGRFVPYIPPGNAVPLPNPTTAPAPLPSPPPAPAPAASAAGPIIPPAVPAGTGGVGPLKQGIGSLDASGNFVPASIPVANSFASTMASADFGANPDDKAAAADKVAPAPKTGQQQAVEWIGIVLAVLALL